MMLSMFVYENDFQEYKPPFDVFELSPQKTVQELRDLDDAKS